MKIRLTHILSTFALLPLLGATLWAEEPLGFADHLFEQREYYRAITEYERFIYEHPSSHQLAHAHFQIGRAYFEGKQYADARKRVNYTLKTFAETPQAKLAPLYLSATHVAEENFGLAAMALDEFGASQIDTDAGQKAVVQSGYYYFRANEHAAAKEILELIPTDSAHFPRAQNLISNLSEYEKLKLKSPKLAGTMSAILPGSGQLYCGRKSDALISFILNGVLIYGAYEAFDNGEHVTGSLLAFIETGWYAGNIYNAVNAAHKVNRAKKDSFLDNVEVGCRPFWSSEELGVNLEGLFKF